MADEKTTPAAATKEAPPPAAATETTASGPFILTVKQGQKVTVENLSSGGRGLRVMKNGMASLFILGPKKKAVVTLADPQNPQYLLWEQLGAVTFSKA